MSQEDQKLRLVQLTTRKAGTEVSYLPFQTEIKSNTPNAERMTSHTQKRCAEEGTTGCGSPLNVRWMQVSVF
jgi:hypothetical protein